MALKYYLAPNHFTTTKSDYIARTQDVESVDFENIIERMTASGSTLTRSDIIAALNTFFEVLQDITKEGKAINTNIIKTSLSIVGTFNDASESFDPNKHEINLNVNLGKVLREALTNVTVEKTTVPMILPNILEVKDSTTDSINQNITSEGVVEIIGSRIKIEGNDSSNGIHFVAQDGTLNTVRTIVENKPSKLIAVAPELPAGKYNLQVTTQYTGGRVLNAPRTGIFNLPLTVA